MCGEHEDTKKQRGGEILLRRHGEEGGDDDLCVHKNLLKISKVCLIIQVAEAKRFSSHKGGTTGNQTAGCVCGAAAVKQQ